MGMSGTADTGCDRDRYTKRNWKMNGSYRLMDRKSPTTLRPGDKLIMDAFGLGTMSFMRRGRWLGMRAVDGSLHYKEPCIHFVEGPTSAAGDFASVIAFVTGLSVIEINRNEYEFRGRKQTK